MTKKDEIQIEIINTILKEDFNGIVLASVRSGKTRILLTSALKHSINILKKENPTILVLYPNIDIKLSWENECKILGINLDITYCTFMSIEKMKDKIFDYIIIDEAHLLGEENQLPIAGSLLTNNKHIIFASGTYNSDTLKLLKAYTGFNLIVNYSTEKAMQDGIIAEFDIFIHKYSLDNVTPVEYGKTKKWMSTEKRECDRISKNVKKTIGKAKMFHSLSRMRFINSTNSLIKNVNKWIKDNPEERFILFTGDEKIGKNYNIPMFNSKSVDNSVLMKFQSGEINQLCLIRKGSAGITYPNLQNILITAINSNGENLEQMIGRALLDDTEKANIHIFVSNESFQLNWLNSALSKIKKNRIYGL